MNVFLSSGPVLLKSRAPLALIDSSVDKNECILMPETPQYCTFVHGSFSLFQSLEKSSIRKGSISALVRVRLH